MSQPDPKDASTAELLGGLSEQIGTLIRHEAAPPLPTETIASVRSDVATVKEAVSR